MAHYVCTCKYKRTAKSVGRGSPPLRRHKNTAPENISNVPTIYAKGRNSRKTKQTPNSPLTPAIYAARKLNSYSILSNFIYCLTTINARTVMSVGVICGNTVYCLCLPIVGRRFMLSLEQLKQRGLLFRPGGILSNIQNFHVLLYARLRISKCLTKINLFRFFGNRFFQHFIFRDQRPYFHLCAF